MTPEIELKMLKQLVENTIAVAATDESDGFITAYHFQTGAIHRLLSAVRVGDYPPYILQMVSPESLQPYVEEVEKFIEKFDE
jgi:hypothetical protein